ncbi:MAG: phospho-sugar mutase [Clostridia bacterium]|nr:phospho-sugar mutase [Clostridia bacterium]
MFSKIYESWLKSDLLSEEEIKELNQLDEKDIEFRFGKNLEFGTAGMRGQIGLGTNMMNVYTVRQATQGLAEYIKSLGAIAMNRGVVISFDTRKFSREFAYNAAIVLAANGIRTFAFSECHPVPMLSFAVRKLNTIAGIMITASHNPKEYNGYKVYGEDGAQMSPDATAEVVKHIEGLSSPLSDKILYDEKYEKKIRVLGKCIDRAYYKQVKKLSLSPMEIKKTGKTIKMVYTPVHGSGNIPVRTILKKIGITPLLVPEQLSFDPEFSTVEVPNPEYKETMTLGIKLADLKGADVVFGTDPDCDRLGVAIRDNSEEFVSLSGNQTGILLLDYVLKRLKETNKLSYKGFAVKSFVSTSMAKLIADDYGIELFDTPVGFKFIGEKIKELDDTGKRQFIFGFEESCGYLRGTHARDKDAVVASMLFAEMVCYYTYHGVKIYDRLQELYSKYGYVFDTNVSTVYSGLNALNEMNNVVDKLKTLKVTKFGGVKVLAVRDYSTLTKITFDGKQEKIDSYKNNAIYYELQCGSFVCVRPSGTEPKLKVYYSVKGEDQQQALTKFEKIKKDFEKLLG